MNSGTLAKLVVLALFLLLAAAPALAATITVDAAGTCSFANAWTAAKNNSDTGGCVGVGTYGDDTIILEKNVTGRDLRTGATRVTVDGQGNKYSRTSGVSFGQHFSVDNRYGNLTIKNLVLADATGGDAKGQSIGSQGSLTILDSVFYNNNANQRFGGAIWISYRGSGRIERSVFYNNGHGAILGEQGNLHVENSVFYNNGGTAAIIVGQGNLRPHNVTLRHVTVAQNTEVGIRITTGVGGKFELSNSIIYNNSNADCNTLSSISGTLDIRNNIIGTGSPFCTTNQLRDDPLLPGVGDGDTFVPLRHRRRLLPARSHARLQRQSAPAGKPMRHRRL